MKASHRVMAQRTNLRGSRSNLTPERMIAIQRAIESRPRLLARVIII